MNRKRILIIDDEIYILHVLEFSLSMEGYRVISAASGEEALGKIESDPPDLIVLDVMMPGMDGHEVCRRLKQDERTCEIPIIFLSARDGAGDRQTGIELGANAYITKPFSPQQLIDQIQTLLEDAQPQGEEAIGM